MLEITPAMVSQWELATRLPAPEQVARILGTLGVTGKRYDQIMFLARHVRDPNWLDASPPDIPAPLTGVIECERTAFRITNWALLIIPGLLQTPDYARAQLTDSGINVEEADIRLVVRLERQKVLTTENPVQLTALISEMAIRELVGSEDIMSDQVDHLVMMADRPNISLRIVPAGGGYHAGKVGLFTMYDFTEAPSTVYLEHHHASAFLCDGEGIRAYRKLTKLLAGKALSEDASRELLREVAR